MALKMNPSAARLPASPTVKQGTLDGRQFQEDYENQQREQ